MGLPAISIIWDISTAEVMISGVALYLCQLYEVRVGGFKLRTNNTRIVDMHAHRKKHLMSLIDNEIQLQSDEEVTADY